jgi:hypothetical protein
MKKLTEDEGAFVAVVVPTRALISELAGKIHEIAKIKSCENEIEICTVPKDGPFKNKTFFVMTQERLFEVLQSGDLYFDYLFIDEAHNISDKSRGVLLHLTLQKMLEDSNPQIIISMPSPRYQNAFDSVFEDVAFTKKETKHSPVAKMFMPVTCKGRKLIISRMEGGKAVSIDKKFKGTKLSSIVHRLGQGESNIVFRNDPYLCEIAARDIATPFPEKNVTALDEAADYIEQFLHHDFTLAGNLRKGVAFHYGPLPSVIRKMIEDLARAGDVQCVVCTSTLAEGVNLPSKNLFLKNPMQTTPRGEKSERLDDVKLSNITGRAGRMLEHFAGNIFIVDPEDWTVDDYFEESEKPIDKIPTYFKVLNEDLAGVLAALSGNLNHETKNQYTYYTIANKLLKEFDNETLHKTIEANELELSDKNLATLEASVKEAHDGLIIDTITLEANPSIGYIQQNSLYSFIQKQNDLAEWVLPHPKRPSFYVVLEKICDILFKAGIFIPKETPSLRFVCLIAKKWVTGDPLKTIIVEQIRHYERLGETYNCNKSVRDVIKVINTDISFRLSSALRCYHSLLTLEIARRNLDIQSVKIYSYIEVGGREDRIVDLVNLGLSRETALEINRLLPAQIEVKSIRHLHDLQERNSFQALHTITKREIVTLLA